jgi:Tol biopolymer transport system component
VFLAAALLGGCEGGGPIDPEGALEVVASGRMERGSVITLTATRDGEPVPAGSVQWVVNPADAAEVLDGGRIRLLRAGNVEVRAASGGRSGGVALQVKAPPTVVFEMTVAGNRDVYRVALDGGDFARLTAHVAGDGEPTVAAGTVVFVSTRTENAELFSIPLAGGVQTQLTNTARAEASPALSLDGQRLAFTADGAGTARKVWTAKATGADAAMAAPGFAASGEAAPAWSPAGDRLAFVAPAEGLPDVYRVVPWGEPEMLASGPGADLDPAWSPDGQRVAFASTRPGGTDIYLVRVSDGAQTHLTTRAGDEGEPTWTPDGRLVYVEFGSGEDTRLVWLDLAAPATVHPIPVPGGAPRHPAATQ